MQAISASAPNKIWAKQSNINFQASGGSESSYPKSREFLDFQNIKVHIVFKLIGLMTSLNNQVGWHDDSFMNV